MEQEQDFQTSSNEAGGLTEPHFDEQAARTAHQVVPLAEAPTEHGARSVWRRGAATERINRSPWLVLASLAVAALVVAALATAYRTDRTTPENAPQANTSGETKERAGTAAPDRVDGNRSGAPRAPSQRETVAADDSRASSSETRRASESESHAAGAGIEGLVGELIGDGRKQEESARTERHGRGGRDGKEDGEDGRRDGRAPRGSKSRKSGAARLVTVFH
ncbi:MAG: hypothetical protein QOF61_1471 [Acidobacteriota bacterium]|nr:hypothetical protein [Acidobacteriota bacterium]